MDEVRRRIAGCMTGTSLDGLDVALVVAEGRGLAARFRVEGFRSYSLSSLQGQLRNIAGGGAMTATQIADLARRFGELHARAVGEVAGGVGIDLVVLHGQTVHHKPPSTWQLVNPWPVALEAKCPVLYDLRSADVAAGGQGAPITPLADWALFRDASERRVVLNLGGFCNFTDLPAGGAPESVQGGDICACNHLLDAAARRALGALYDEGGAAGLRGTVRDDASSELRMLLSSQARAARSLGTGDESVGWVNKWAGRLPGEDLLASLAEAVGRVIAERIGDADRVLCAGGGAKNRSLLAAIERAIGKPVETTEALGIGVQQREAVCMAVLGALCADGVAVTLPQVTRSGGAAAPMAGSWINLPASTFPIGIHRTEAAS
ncbi:MAG: anhydro-N-acetylmuramic acid kinase [Planctomycetota bacterium]|nr:anhydro-N-acetylmuramic acid kinase [Planctomycetota bacterium]